MTIIRPFNKIASHRDEDEWISDINLKEAAEPSLMYEPVEEYNVPQEVKEEVEGQYHDLESDEERKKFLKDTSDLYHGTELEGWAEDILDEMRHHEIKQDAKNALIDVIGEELFDNVFEHFDADIVTKPIVSAMWREKGVDEAIQVVVNDIEKRMLPTIESELELERRNKELEASSRFMTSPEEDDRVEILTDPKEIEQMPNEMRMSSRGIVIKKQASLGGELMSTILSFLEALSKMYENMHWKTEGPNYYGDHLLYERLYESVSGEVDPVAEKIVGVFGADFVGPNKNTAETHEILETLFESDDMSSDSFSTAAIDAEEKFIGLVGRAIEEMEKADDLTNGIDNLLQGIVDVHEGHLYLLKQRAGKKESGAFVGLYKLAYKLDKKGQYDEAQEIEKVMAELAQRAGVDRFDMISLADYFDEIGDKSLADYFDDRIKG